MAILEIMQHFRGYQGSVKAKHHTPSPGPVGLPGSVWLGESWRF